MTQGGIAPMPVVAVTGASGYLGSRLCAALEASRYETVRLVRRPGGDAGARSYDLTRPLAPGLLDGVDVLVHGAYDFGVTRRADIWRVNVEGTRRLLSAARAADVSRVIVISTMSAYAGTKQLYGQAKLAIEATAQQAGACVVRPGLVYGGEAGGMAGALRRVAQLPIVPLIAGGARQYPVHEDDVTAAIVALVAAEHLPVGPVGIAQPTTVSFRELLESLASRPGRPSRFVAVPWQLLYGALRAGELLSVPLPFRADSLLGLVHPAPSVPGAEVLPKLGVSIRPLAPAGDMVGRAR